jgi:hypothetical protein
VSRFVAAPTPLGPKKIDFHLSVAVKDLPFWLSALNPFYARFLSRQIFKGSTDDYDAVWKNINTGRRRVLVADDRFQQRFRRYYRAHLPGAPIGAEDQGPFDAFH